jgi:dTDP-4-amino-4,6-dideoxygalactose transaminase
MSSESENLPWELPGAHWIGKEEFTLVDQVLKSKSPFRYYGLDLQHMVDQLEKRFCEKFSVPYALGVNSGTAALYISLAGLGIGPGDEVLLPGYMWVSCISAIVRLGAIPRLVDIDDTFCMDPIDLKAKITEHSRAVLYVHMSGAPGHIDQVTNIAKENNIFLLEDCAQAAGAQFKNQYVGTFGDIAIFSFQLNKNMTSGEGGMIICQDQNIYKRCFALHDLGYARNEQGRLNTHDSSIQLWGVGSRMSELTGAFALAQLDKLDDIIYAMRTAKWKIRESIQCIEQIKFRNILDSKGDSGPFLITIYPSEEICHAFVKQLILAGVHGPAGSLLCVPMSEWGLHWYFNNMSLVNKTSISEEGFPWSHPDNAFAKHYSYTKGTLPYCDEMAKRSMILAIPSCLTEEHIQLIIKAFEQVSKQVF